MAYYTSNNCYYTGGQESVSDGCKTDYNESDVKYVVDNWSTSVIDSKYIKEARLIKYDELIDELGFEYINPGPLNPSMNGDTPSWVSVGSSWYWSMGHYEDSNNAVWYVGGAELSYLAVWAKDGLVRPVVVLYKKAFEKTSTSSEIKTNFRTNKNEM